VLGDKQILFMKNHGVLVVGDTVAQAYRRLYKLERVCRAQIHSSVSSPTLTNSLRPSTLPARSSASGRRALS
ncbi:MAG: class II aldolase, partial [Sphingomonadales bacterium]